MGAFALAVEVPMGVQGVQTPTLLIRVPFFEKNMCSKHVVNAVTV